MSEPEIRIVVDDLSGAEIAALLAEHLAGMHAHSPAESVHALDLERLRQPEVTFWSAWVGEALAGCGALKALGSGEGEIKSMRTRDAFRRAGIGARMLATIVETARQRGYRRLCLETGSGAAFDAAHALYRRHGFVECGPFGPYVPDPFSHFYVLELTRPGD